MPRSEKEDDRRRERIFNIIVFGILILATFADILTFIQDAITTPEYKSQGGLVLLGICTFFLLLYFASRKGYFKIASYVFIAAFFLVLINSLAEWGVSLPAGLLCFSLLIVMATILVGNRFGMIVLFCSAVAIFGFGIHEASIKLVPEWKHFPIGISDLFEYTIILSFAALLSWLYNREMEKSLKRARLSEQTLEEERDNLEMLVIKRTEDLRAAERAHMAELYRFAEFGKLSAGLFHDLINPLTSVTLSVGNLSKNPTTKTSEEAKQSIDIAINATRRMEQYMNTIKKKIKSSDSSESFFIKKEIEDAIQIFQYPARQKQIELSLKCPQDIALHGNPLKFNQVISNLVANAIDAYEGTPSSRNDNKKVTVSALVQKEHLVIHVKDRGIGIREEDIEKIFTPFFTTKEKGIGLGLSTTKDIVEQNFKGTLKAESQKGHTTIFTVSIPLSQEQTLYASEGTHAQSPQQGS